LQEQAQLRVLLGHFNDRGIDDQFPQKRAQLLHGRGRKRLGIARSACITHKGSVQIAEIQILFGRLAPTAKIWIEHIFRRLNEAHILEIASLALLLQRIKQRTVPAHGFYCADKLRERGFAKLGEADNAGVAKAKLRLAGR
jgi:hypothetical protein